MGTQFSLTPEDIINLKKESVSDRIIAAIVAKGQQSSVAKTDVSAAAIGATKEQGAEQAQEADDITSGWSFSVSPLMDHALGINVDSNKMKKVRLSVRFKVLRLIHIKRIISDFGAMKTIFIFILTSKIRLKIMKAEICDSFISEDLNHVE